MNLTELLYREISFKCASSTSSAASSTTSASSPHSASTSPSSSTTSSSSSTQAPTPTSDPKPQALLTPNNKNSNSLSLSSSLPPQVYLATQHSPYQHFKLGWQRAEKVGGGLVNIGNTCFLNSVLQCLTYCPPLNNLLVEHPQKCKLNSFCMLCEMERHVKRIRSANGQAIRPTAIHQRLQYISKSFQFGRQEDAHEFLRYLIDHMWKACLLNMNLGVKISKLDAKTKEATIINHIFGGYHRSQVQCLTCNTRSNTYDYFMDLILDIRNVSSLEKALEKFTQAEILQNDNAYKCSKCQKKVAARKKFTIFKAPNVATFQFKRFDSDRIFGGKITKHINYLDELDLRPFMSDPSQGPIKYKLSGVLVHVGHSSNSGHYYSFIKNSDDLWYRMDDSKVTQVSRDTALDQQAYLLFYTRCDSAIPSNNSKPETKVVQATNRPFTSIHNTNSHLNNINNNSNHSINNYSSNNNSNTINLSSTSNNKLTTWSGSKSLLESPTSKHKIEDLDEYNDELDRGKLKKVKFREEKFKKLSKFNQFQKFSNNYHQYRHYRNKY